VTARGTIAVSRDPRRAEEIAGALGDGAVAIAPDAVVSGSPERCVLHATDAAEADAFVARLPTDCRVTMVLPRAELATILDRMAASERVVALHVDDVPLERLTPRPIALSRTVKVGTFYERTRCIAEVVRFAEKSGVPRAVLASIEQCVDELLVNALYDAPVDDRGKRMFAGISVQTRATLRVPQEVELAYGCDGNHFTVSVRDAFGSLERATVLRVLARGFHAENKVDRKQGGAGLGLYLLLHDASTVCVRVTPGQSTEVTCTFELATKPHLEQFVLDVGPAVVEPRAFAARMLPVASPATVRSRRLLVSAVAMIALLGAGLFVALPRLFAVRPTSTLELDTVPSGAAVAVDGKRMGGTPIRIASLSPGATISIALVQPGYRDATVQFKTPAANETRRVVHALERSPQFARVQLVSTPPGARILLDNRELSIGRTYTPATVFVEANQPQQFALVMPGRVPVVLEPIVAAPSTNVEKSATLVPGPTLRVEARSGSVTVEGAPGCTDKLVPATCSLATGSYAVVWVDGPNKVTRTVQVTGDTVERF
jgi:PEGA domain